MPELPDPSVDAVRCFLALEAPASLVEAVRKTRPAVIPLAPHARWTPDARLHLTLRFLGSMAPDEIARLTAALHGAAPLGPPFALRPAGVGTFGRPPRVLWAGVAEGKEQLLALAARIDAVVDGLGMAPRDLPLRPHFTLARAASQGGPALSAAAGAFKGFLAPRERAHEVVLLQSTPVGGQLTYQPLARFSLS